MSERVRSLESAYRTSGEASDLLAWIRARQRAGLFAENEEGQESEEERLALWVEAMAEGRLQPEQLELAAYLGDPLARLLDEERAISLATYLGDGLELVPLVLGEAADPESTARWIVALGYWCPSWIAEAQWAIADYHLQRYVAPELAADDPYAEEIYLYREHDVEYWRAALDALRARLDSGTPCDLWVDGYGELARLVQAAAEFVADSGTLSWASLELGPDPEIVPECVRAALIPKVLKTS